MYDNTNGTELVEFAANLCREINATHFENLDT